MDGPGTHHRQLSAATLLDDGHGRLLHIVAAALLAGWDELAVPLIAAGFAAKLDEVALAVPGQTLTLTAGRTFGSVHWAPLAVEWAGVYGGAMDGEGSLDDLGRELRRRVGEEMRLEAEMLEQDAASVELRRREIGDVAVELMSRGDLVTVIAGEKQIKGCIEFARGEVASLRTTSGLVDVHLTPGVVLRVDERSNSGGRPPHSGSETMRARMLEHELSSRRVTVWSPAVAMEVTGQIAAVGKDHVIVSDIDEARWVFRLEDVAWAIAV